ncbi:microfibrillar-associated protein 5 [Pogona vitticeps]
MVTCGAQKLLCLIALAVLPFDWFLPVVTAQQDPQDPTGVLNAELTTDATDTLDVADPGETAADEKDVSGPATSPECREEQFPCTRLYSVHKPVKQCISYLCITTVRRTYMINKEICSRIVCKEDEAMQEEICRQIAGLPPRRLRRSHQLRGSLCRQAQNQQLNTLDA